MAVSHHPGQTLKAELAARGLTATQFAWAIHKPTNLVTEIIRGRRSITAQTALRFARALGVSAEFWMNLQTQCDLAYNDHKYGDQIDLEVEVLL